MVEQNSTPTPSESAIAATHAALQTLRDLQTQGMLTPENIGEALGAFADRLTDISTGLDVVIVNRERAAFLAGWCACFDDQISTPLDEDAEIDSFEKWLAAWRPVFYSDDDGGCWLRPVVSSHIAEAGYQSAMSTVATSRLVVRFTNGNLVEYRNVTRQWFDAFLAAESKGKFFVGVKRDAVAYPWRKLSS